MEIPFIQASFINDYNYFPELINRLKMAFAAKEINVPQRHHHEIDGYPSGTMLLMPAWASDHSMGVKLVNVFPENKDLPSINGLYIHFNRSTGEPRCIIDAKSLTNKRTAAASALASSLLSRVESRKLLLIGTGALAPDLIKAHLSVRPIKEVFIWGRNPEKASLVAEKMSASGISFKPIDDLDEYIPKMDIISAATMAKDPIIKGRLVSPGTHIDLVGSYKPDMREADDDLIIKADICVDTIEGATRESGDIVIPLNQGLLSIDEIKGELSTICSKGESIRKSDTEITLFKSVGYALEDLVAGEYYYQKWLKHNG